MQIKTKFIIFIIILVIVVGGIGFVSNKYKTPKVNLDDFAQCLDGSGAKFYGSFWCAHCQAQKEMFGSSKKYLPYIECSTPDGQNQLDICKDADIEGYPTWVFADESRLSGKISLKVLAEKTNCLLPK